VAGGLAVALREREQRAEPPGIDRRARTRARRRDDRRD
jgi:hypothetical protein